MAEQTIIMNPSPDQLTDMESISSVNEHRLSLDLLGDMASGF